MGVHVTRAWMDRRSVLAGMVLGPPALASCASLQGPAAEAGLHPALPLDVGFANPPNEARPRTWWHWMNGNVTVDGIGKDLTWMKRIGLGGFHAFDAALDTPQVVDRRLVYMSPEWKEAFRYSTALAAELDLEMGIAASPGWSETGGPWVQPQQAMKKVVWSDVAIEGGAVADVELPLPPHVAGVFQSIGINAPPVGDPPPAAPDFYRDIVVLAYPVEDEAPTLPQPDYAVEQGAALDGAVLTDGRYNTSVEVSTGGRTPAAVLVRYDRPQTIRSLEFYAPDISSMFFGSALEPLLDASDDGRSWREVTSVPVSAAPTTVSFAPITASHFRLRLEARPGSDAVEQLSFPERVRIARLALSPSAKIHAFEMKAGFVTARDYFALDSDVGPDTEGVAPARVVDVSRHVLDGRLRWRPPHEGRWKIVRLGYSLTGTQNHPATREATGLEVDKYDAGAVRNYVETYLSSYSEAVGADLFGHRGLSALVKDSTEVGGSNWTPLLLRQFRRLRGYDALPWLVTLTGQIIGSRRQSDAFLFDFRRTLAELIASEHYGTVASVGRAHGLTVYEEALEAGRPVLGDDLEMRRFADIPMAALWSWRENEPGTRPALIADAKGASSVAHVYGRPIAAAESLTQGFSIWSEAPADLKRVVDLEFCLGINRIVIHASPHQPLDDKQPGFSLSIFGQSFTRHETWAEMARPWIDYIARSSFLLQQGSDVADVAYFYGEDGSPTALFQYEQVADAPRRHAFDYLPPHALLNLARVEDGEVVLPSGARYRAIYLGGSSTRRMTLPVLRKLAALVRDGASLIGARPEATPSLMDDLGEWDRLASLLWPGEAFARVGAGSVAATADVEAGLSALGTAPDFSYSTQDGDAEIAFVHRRLVDGQLYFVSNRQRRAHNIEARFRVTGKSPELWRADTGEQRALSYRISNGETVVPLELGPDDAVFILFRTNAAAPEATVPTPVLEALGDVNGPWRVAFQAGRGAPEEVVLRQLRPLNQHSDARIRYFSGVAHYQTTLRRPPGGAGLPLVLDLGVVGDVAEVFLDGRAVGSTWRSPHLIELGVLDEGNHVLEVRVANLWLNRIVGDLQPGAAPVAFISNQIFSADTPLRASGLIGPVRLLARISINSAS